MTIHTIDAPLLRSLFLAGAKRLEDNKEMINMLNVFPVPDGDTGTNMSMTLQSAVAEINKIEDPSDMEALCRAISSGSLRGARGNSGVILSQLLRGFTRTVREEKHSELDAAGLAAAIGKASETASKAVMKPMEGTILTVAREMAEAAIEIAQTDGEEEVTAGKEDLLQAMETVVAKGNETLKQTPEMLPVLKEAGVVDSGGQGLIAFMEGALDQLRAASEDPEAALKIGQTPAISAVEIKNTEEIIRKERVREHISTDDIKFGYCTEFLIMTGREATADDENQLKEYLSGIGDSIVCVADEDIIKIHVHTNDPGLAIQKALTYGALSNLKIDNMRLEHENTLVTQAELDAAEMRNTGNASAVSGPGQQISEEESGRDGFVTVAAGDGMAEIFREMGADVVISGGQTMNPSTDDIMHAIETLPQQTVYILPNNKNIIMAADQARELTEDRQIIVIPTKTMPQGLTALITYDESAGDEENAEAMQEACSATKTCEVTFAVRTTKIQGHKIKKGDIMGLDDGGIRASGSDVDEVVIKLLDNAIDEESAVISIFYGEDVSDEDAEALRIKVEDQFPDLDVDLQRGGQPVYFYILAIMNSAAMNMEA